MRLISQGLMSAIIVLPYFLLAGCSTSSQVSAVKIAEAMPAPGKVLIVDNSSENDFHNEAMGVFKAAVRQALANCHVSSSIIHVPVQQVSLSLDNVDLKNQHAITTAVQSFGPDYMLIVSEPHYEIAPQTYSFELIGLADKKTVWSGGIVLHHAGVFSGMKSIGNELARALTGQMKQDGIFGACIGIM